MALLVILSVYYSTSIDNIMLVFPGMVLCLISLVFVTNGVSDGGILSPIIMFRADRKRGSYVQQYISLQNTEVSHLDVHNVKSRSRL